MNDFVPELGHILYGEPQGQSECPAYLEAALGTVRERLREVMGAALGPEKADRWADPFSNTSNSFSCREFTVSAYQWSDPPVDGTFRSGEVEVFWYKHLARDTSCARIPAHGETARMLRVCLDHLDRIDDIIRKEARKEPLSADELGVLAALRADNSWHVKVPDVACLRPVPLADAGCTVVPRGI